GSVAPPRGAIARRDRCATDGRVYPPGAAVDRLAVEQALDMARLDVVSVLATPVQEHSPVRAATTANDSRPHRPPPPHPARAEPGPGRPPPARGQSSR